MMWSFFLYRASLITCMAAGNRWWTESREPQTSCWPGRSVVLSVLNLDWASMSEPHTSGFNVDCTSVCMLWLARPAWLVNPIALRYLLPPRVPTVLPHSISFIEQVCPTVKSHLKDWEGGWMSCHIVPPIHCYLAHAHPTMFYIHLQACST